MNFAEYLGAGSRDTGWPGRGVGGGNGQLRPGAVLHAGQTLSSPNGAARLVMQTDGNLVLYDRANRALWNTGRNGAVRAVMQTDGNFVTYDARGRARFDTKTSGRPGAILAVQDDGNMVVYTGTYAHWASRGAMHRSLVGGVTHAIGGAAKAAGKAATHLPGVALVNALGQGKSLKNALKAEGHAVTGALRTAGTVASFVPGIGTLPAMGLSTAAAIGRGESLKNIGLSAARAALPGGEITKSAFDLAVGLAKGKSFSQVSLAAVRQNIPGGAIAQQAFDAGVNIAKGGNVGAQALAVARSQIKAPAALKAFDTAIHLSVIKSATPAALQSIRNMIPGPPAARAAFDAGMALASGANHSQIKAAISRVADPLAQQTIAKAALAHKAASALEPPRRVRRAARVFAKGNRAPRKMSGRGLAFVRNAIARKRGTAGIDQGGLTYTVETNDSAWRIANNLTTDGNAHWKELLIANPKKTVGSAGKWRLLKPGEIPKNTDNFHFLVKGEKLNIPQAWRDLAAAEIARRAKAAGQAPPAPPPAAEPPAPEKTVSIGAPQTAVDIAPPGTVAPPPVPPPAAVPSPATVVAPGATGAERDDVQAVAQAKLILSAWEYTDGAGAAGLVDYGKDPADVSPIWGPRDSYELLAFCQWVNSHQTGVFANVTLETAGDLTQRKLDALVAWADSRGFQTAPGGTPPIVMTAPAAPQKPAAEVLPGAPANGLPPITPASSQEDRDAHNAALEKADQAAAANSPAQASTLNLPDTLIKGNPKSGADWALLLALGVGAVLLANSGKKTTLRRVA